MFSKEYLISVASQADINLNLPGLQYCHTYARSDIIVSFPFFYDVLVVTTNLYNLQVECCTA
jgi:hypothetical protein